HRLDQGRPRLAIARRPLLEMPRAAMPSTGAPPTGAAMTPGVLAAPMTMTLPGAAAAVTPAALTPAPNAAASSGDLLKTPAEPDFELNPVFDVPAFLRRQ